MSLLIKFNILFIITKNYFPKKNYTRYIFINFWILYIIYLLIIHNFKI